jgi:CHAT domain-containing protein/tetratricopeptide (TPR) repeat protein
MHGPRRQLAFVVLAAFLCSVYASASQSPPAQAPAADLGQSIFARIQPDDCKAAAASDISALKLAADGFHRRGDRENEIRALALLGTLDEQAGDFQSARPLLESALRLSAQQKDSAAKAQLLIAAADALTAAGESDAAYRDANDAFNMGKRLSDAGVMASALRARAEAHFGSALADAKKDLGDAQPLSEQAKDAKTEALILNDQGAALQDSGSPFDIFQHAITLEDQVHDCRDKIATLTNLATLEHDRGRIRDALDHYNEAVALEKTVGDRTTEAETLHQLGYFHWELGDLGQALGFFNQALALKQKLGDRSSAGPTQAALAGVYRDARLPAAALRAYQQALPVLEQTKNVPWQVEVLNNMGAVEADLHHPAEARDFYNRSVKLAPPDEPVTPAYSAWGIGELEQADALKYYFLANLLAREFQQADLEGEVDSSLMDHFRAHHQPNTAIFFGKRAIDQFQQIRWSMKDAGDDLTASFLQMKSGTYRTLASILMDEGRLIEAQQVLDLLKIQQFSDYTGGQFGALSQPLARSPREVSLEPQLEQQLSRLVDLDKALRATEGAKPRQASAVLQAQKASRAAQSDFDAFLASVYRQLEARDGPAAAVEAVTGMELPLEKLVAGDPHLAAIYTLEGAESFRVMTITHAGRVPYSSAITQDKLDDDCRHFLELLKDPQSDQKTAIDPAAEKLFDIILGPIEKDLESAQITSLVWYLDGSLRYIPIAALKNAKTGHYAVDDYDVVSFTPLDNSLESIPEFSGASAIGMGTSRNYDGSLGPLQNTAEELGAVVTDPAVDGSHGVLPGTILMDEKFTEKALEAGLQSQAVVLIATHFVLTPGNDDLSYLLLGGKDDAQARGYKYSMASFQKSEAVHIKGTRLFTLSACETGAANERAVCFEQDKDSVTAKSCEESTAGERENGVVMEGMSEVVMEKGAEAVLSSLWSVNDASTSDLMKDFYARWVGSGGKVSKSEALRQAELDLLHGRVVPKPDYSDPNAPTSFAAPYYWAPFVLMGNWQ